MHLYIQGLHPTITGAVHLFPLLVVNTINGRVHPSMTDWLLYGLLAVVYVGTHTQTMTYNER